MSHIHVQLPPVSRSLGDLAVGGLFLDGETWFRKVTVTGQTPTSGKSFALTLTTGMEVSEQPNDMVLPQSHDCSGPVRVTVRYEYHSEDELPEISVTLGGLSVGDVFQLGGDLYFVVWDPLHDPPEGSAWVWMIKGSAVTSLSTGTSVCRVLGAVTALKPC